MDRAVQPGAKRALAVAQLHRNSGPFAAASPAHSGRAPATSARPIRLQPDAFQPNFSTRYNCAIAKVEIMPKPTPLPPAILLRQAPPPAKRRTACALALARRLPVEIISVDSALVYRDMDIGTAKPAPTSRPPARTISSTS